METPERSEPWFSRATKAFLGRRNNVESATDNAKDVDIMRRDSAPIVLKTSAAEVAAYFKLKDRPIVAVRVPDEAIILWPVVGSKPGMPYANHFAIRFVAWICAEGLPRRWQVDKMVEVASWIFGMKAELEMPFTRNFLTAMKRIPGVSVERNVRIYDRDGELMGKRSFYQIGEMANNQGGKAPNGDDRS